MGGTKPAIMRKVVVLPQPEGPSSATSSPGDVEVDALDRDCAPNCLPGLRARAVPRSSHDLAESDEAVEDQHQRRHRTICAIATAETSGSMRNSRYCSMATGSW